MNKNLREKGITLVALVVTIIILLILAGITVSLVVGQNGLLQRAQTASNTMANATANEITQMGKYANEVDELTSGFIAGGGSEQEGQSGGNGSGGSNSTITVVAARGTPEVPIPSGTLADIYVDEIKGAYVKYGAGIWGNNNDSIMQQLGKEGNKYENYSGTVAPSQQGQFGGWKPNTWVATGASASDENGQFFVGTIPAWQILGKDDNGCIKLMATYITEEFVHTSYQSSNSQALLQGNGNRSFSVYENTLLAVSGSGHAMTSAEANTLTADLRATTRIPGLANYSPTDYYWLGTAANSAVMYYTTNSGNLIANDQVVCSGVRPVVTLKSDVLYSGSGTVEDPYIVGYSE